MIVFVNRKNSIGETNISKVRAAYICITKFCRCPMIGIVHVYSSAVQLGQAQPNATTQAVFLTPVSLSSAQLAGRETVDQPCDRFW